MKLYSISRIHLFAILIEFDFQLSHAGELFVDAIMSEDMAAQIAAKWPNAITPLYPPNEIDYSRVRPCCTMDV